MLTMANLFRRVFEILKEGKGMKAMEMEGKMCC